jgi:L-fucose isomerase-like protein
MSEKLRIAVLFGNRGFFPGEVVAKAREEMRQAIEMAGFIPVLMDEKLTRYGAIESLAEGKIFADFLAKERVDGVVICLPNFGDETGAATACRDAGVPILIQAYPDEVGKMDFANRRDSFCGKLSIMRVFRQFGIPFSIDTPHVIHPLNPRFIEQLKEFGGVCRVVNGMRRCTVGAIGARTTPFKTVRYDEITLQKYGISVETVDLSEVFGKIALLKDDDAKVVAAVKAIKRFYRC